MKNGGKNIRYITYTESVFWISAPLVFLRYNLSLLNKVIEGDYYEEVTKTTLDTALYCIGF